MAYREFLRRSITFVIIIVLTVLLVVLAVRLMPILVIALLCWIISIGLTIPINFLRHRGLRRGTAVALTFFLTAIALVLFTGLLLPPLAQQINNLLAELPGAIEVVIREYGRFRAGSEFLMSALPPFTIEDFRALTAEGTTLPLDTTAIARSTLPLLADIGGFLGSIAVNLFLITFITIYFVLNPLVYYRMILAVTPSAYEQRAVEVLNQIRTTVITWIGAMVLEVTITAILVAVALGVLRLPNAIALGLIAGLGNIVPYVGYWAALLPIVIFALAAGGPVTALLAFAAYFIIGIVEANIILPANVGSKLSLPAGLVLLAQAAGAALLGFWGVLLAVPLLAILMVLVRELLVFDALGKRGRVPVVQETPTGEIVLVPLPVEVYQQPAQMTPLTTTEEHADSVSSGERGQ